MKRLKKIAGLVVGLWLFGAVPVAATDVNLWETAFNLNGDAVPLYAWGDPTPVTVPALPAGFAMDLSGFNFDTGLGTVSIRFSPGAAGSYYVAGYFDHEIDEEENTYYNETGWAMGAPNVGQSWEIDEPGWGNPDTAYYGDIYSNAMAGQLDSLVFYDAVDGWFNPADFDDVAMAMGWDFSLSGDLEFAIIDFILSETAPTSGFYLVHHDPDSAGNLYFSSSLDISAIPEPGTLLLLGGGFVGLVLLRRLRK